MEGSHSHSVLTLECAPSPSYSHQDVSTRSCYLFSRLSKQLHLNLRPFVPTILQALQPHLARIVTRPVADLPLTLMGSGGGGGGGGGAGGVSGTGRDVGSQRAGASLVVSPVIRPLSLPAC